MSRSIVGLARLARRSHPRAPLTSSSSRLGVPALRSPESEPGLQNGAPVTPGLWSRTSVRAMSADHTAKWMQEMLKSVESGACLSLACVMKLKNTDEKSPMELISEVPPIEVDARVAACEGGRDPALGHPVEFISLDAVGPAVCKYCGLRYVQRDAHGHH